MQISTITVLGLLSSGVTASIVPSTALPECAQLCLKDLHQKVGCAKADASCICSHTDAVLNQFAPCVNAKCTKTADVGGGLRHVLGLCESKQGNHRDFKRMLLALAKRDETDPEKETEQDTQEENETTVSGNGVSDPLTIEATKKVNETVPANAPLVVATDPAVNNPETLTTLPVNQTGTSTPTTTPDVLANTASLTQTNTTIDAGAQPETPENPETSGNSLAGTSTLSADDVSKSAELTDDSEKAENTEDSQDVEEATDDPNKEEETYDETDSYGSYGAYNETSLAGARYHNKTNPYKSPKSSDKGDKGDNPGTKTSKGNSKDKDNGASTLSTGLFLMVASLIIAIA